MSGKSCSGSVLKLFVKWCLERSKSLNENKNKYFPKHTLCSQFAQKKRTNKYNKPTQLCLMLCFQWSTITRSMVSIKKKDKPCYFPRSGLTENFVKEDNSTKEPSCAPDANNRNAQNTPFLLLHQYVAGQHCNKIATQSPRYQPPSLTSPRWLLLRKILKLSGYQKFQRHFFSTSATEDSHVYHQGFGTDRFLQTVNSQDTILETKESSLLQRL